MSSIVSWRVCSSVCMSLFGSSAVPSGVSVLSVKVNSCFSSVAKSGICLFYCSPLILFTLVCSTILI